jgi:hypothetical protein
VQTRDYVVIANEMIHDVRIVPLDGRPRLAAGIRRWQGDPRGHWDGDTLVVETTNFSDRTSFRGSDTHLRLVERFRRVDAKTLDYQFTVDDASVFSRPWTVSLPMTTSDGPDLRIRVPRGELRHDRYPARRARAGAGKVSPGRRLSRR